MAGVVPCLSRTGGIAGTVLAALAGCAGMPAGPQIVDGADAPYARLDERSYGPRSTRPIVSCDPATQQIAPWLPAGSPAPERDALQEGVHDFAQSLVSPLSKPLGPLLKVDRTMVDADLLTYFKIPGDSNYPAVAVLARSEREIVFWHSAMLASPKEVAAAAAAYCGRSNRTARHEGSAVQCQPAKTGRVLGTNYGVVMKETFVISKFVCGR